MSQASILPLVAVTAPLAGAAAAMWASRRGDRRLPLILATVAASVSLAAVYALLTGAGEVFARVPYVLLKGFDFSVTPAGLLLALLASALWLTAALFSLPYLAHGHAAGRYTAALLLSLAGTLAVFLAGDLFTLFVGFEVMSFSAYLLVVHEETPAAMRAGTTYLFMSVASGLLVLLGLFTLEAAAGTTAFTGPSPLEAIHGPWAYAAVAAMLAGFGIKAGMVPLHIWLPQAHPVAPAPASALLSGVMIKTGAYGILRVALSFIGTDGHGGLSSVVGPVLVVMALVTMFTGAAMAAVERSAKRILACSSVSQIGYVLLAIGCAVVLGHEGGMGVAGALFHIVNHALFKSALFLMIGAVYLAGHELDITRLGGMARRMPVTALAFGLATFGLAGVPGLNGYASKTLVHDALLEVIRHTHSPWYAAAEKLFTLTSAITVFYSFRLLYYVFLRPAPAGAPAGQEGRLVRAIGLAYIGALLAVGLRPLVVVERFILPAMHEFRLDHHALDHLAHFHFFEAHPLQGAAIPLGIGLALWFGLRGERWLKLSPPAWLSVEGLVYRPLIAAATKLCCLVTTFDRAIDQGYRAGARAAKDACHSIALADGALDRSYASAARSSGDLCRQLAEADTLIDSGYRAAAAESYDLCAKLSDADHALDESYGRAADGSRGLVLGLQRVDAAIDDGYHQAVAAARGAVGQLTQAEAALDGGSERVARSGRRFLSDLNRPDRTRWSLANLNVATLIMAALLAALVVVFALLTKF